jgi:hypothetical protein
VIEPNPNQDPLWQDLSSISSTAQAYGFEIAIHPQPHFPESPDDWWISAPLDFSWWNSWFDQYYNFALHFAEAAEQQGADILILGGDWLMPALPGGKLANGDPSGVPADSELRWKKIIEDVQEHFSGTLAWTLSIPEKNLSNEYLSSVDQIHLNWNPDIVTSESSSLEELIFQANTSLDTEVQEFWSAWTNTNNKELVLRIAYPSVSGWNINCLQDEDPNCYDLSSFATPAPDIPELSIDFDLQARVYTALLSSITRQNWVSGIISRGYYSPVILHDKSISIHGKPAETVLSQWFGGLR